LGDRQHEEAELSKAVVDYLSEHPEAMETLEGIAEWWLARQRVRVEVARVARTVADLTDKGVLERVGSGENARYRLKK
jgi:hypothetical protein